MRWTDVRVRAFLKRNTRVFHARMGGRTRPNRRDLVACHWQSGGWMDHLLGFWLVPFTLGISAWVWKRFMGSCTFAGVIDTKTGRLGCLVHPARVGLPDLRRHAFPLIPTMGCNRELRCRMLNESGLDMVADAVSTSRRGWASL